MLLLLKIIKPTWYYYEERECTLHWVDYRNLSPQKKLHIDYCDLYDDENASLLDAMYQALHRGFIKGTVGSKIEKNYHLSFFDQYLRDTRIPNLEYKITNDGLAYRYTNCVEGFDMEVADAKGKVKLKHV